jgi:hypothetical protein
MTHHVQFPQYLPQGRISVDPYLVDTAGRPRSGRQLQGLNTMCQQSYSAFCVKRCRGAATLSLPCTMLS